MKDTTNKQPFITDVTNLRKQARAHLEDGAVTSYLGDTNRPSKFFRRFWLPKLFASFATP